MSQLGGYVISMKLGRFDILVLAAAVVLSCTAFCSKYISFGSLSNVPVCLPCDEIAFFDPGKKTQPAIPKAVIVHEFQSEDALISYQGQGTLARIVISDGETCSYDATTAIFHCNGTDLPTCMFDCFPFEIDFDESSREAGFKACKAVREIANILGLPLSSDYEPWYSLYPTLKQLYFGRFEERETSLRSDELLAIFMPLLLPVVVMLVRILLKKA